MPSPDMWEWLRHLERRNNVVAEYMNTYRQSHKLNLYPVVALSTESLVGLVEALVDSHEKMQELMRKTAMRYSDPPIWLVDKSPGDVGLRWRPGDLQPGGMNIIWADEWPKTERSVVEHSKVVYFRDFLRSLWRRLTERPHP